MAREAFTITGRFAPPDFTPWIERHARRLGLSLRVTAPAPDRLTLLLDGPPDLLDAMEMGCLLGPREVWVETIDRHGAPPEAA
ncbi:MAG: acylphosphatase [Paracoccus sp. (in: a-proteobacteria)]|uniref:acylphosphatase n=1 Tax=Paracoccus sp. TaxID=267 RepID=UPI0039E62479